MPGFELEQVGGGSPIDLPYGENILGRGPFLGSAVTDKTDMLDEDTVKALNDRVIKQSSITTVSELQEEVNDKRVSRNHCILENKNGHLRLKPTHLNPCFIQTSIVADPQPLEKDVWHFLREGDVFSLMPGRYIYRVHVKQEDKTPRNSQGFDEEMEEEKCLSGSAEISEDSSTPHGEKDTAITQSSTLTGSQTQDTSSHTHFSLDEAPALPQKKRILPDWMMACGSAGKSPSCAKGDNKAVRGTPKQPKRAATPKVATKSKRPRAERVSSEEEEDEVPRRKAKRLKSDSEDELGDATALKSTSVGSVRDGPSGESDSTGLMERDNGMTKGDVAGARVQSDDSQTQDSSNLQADQGPSQQGSKVKESESKTSIRMEKKQRRTPCPYGSSCYRKNPLHFQESSHPGDSDYEEEQTEDGEDDERPECPYGTHCYRKNPLHKKEYKHTKSPPKSPAAADDDEDEDKYDASFINDDSEEEDVDEDSEYVPESDDSGKEDIKRLQKEAKAFLRKKK